MSTETITTYAGGFVDGAEHPNRGPALPVTNPATGQVFAEVPAGTEADVDAAVRAATRAFAEWAALAVSKRGEILGKAASHVEEHLDELIPLLTREQGKTLRDARIEIAKGMTRVSGSPERFSHDYPVALRIHPRRVRGG